MRSRALVAGICAALPALFSACPDRPFHRPWMADASFRGHGIASICVLPLPPRDDPAVTPAARARLRATLESALTDAGHRVAPDSAVDTAWRDALSHTDGDGATAATVAAHLHAAAGCDLLAEPAVVARPADVDFQRAAWDGVERPLRLDGPAVERERFRMDATLRGLSLRVVIRRAPSGERGFASIGGLALADRMVWRRSHRRWEREPDPDALTPDDVLARGVALALHPFVPAPDYPDSPDYGPEEAPDEQ